MLADQQGTPKDAATLFPGKTLARWTSHEARFIRAALHIGHRLRQRGYLVSPEGMSVAGERDGLSDGMEYHPAIKGELNKMIDVTIVEILKTQAPAAFVDLWQRDTQQLATISNGKAAFGL
jgi:hypothetical protein